MAPVMLQIMKETQSPLTVVLTKIFPESEKGV